MGLERLRIEKCCCCASLRTGCLIIAILSLLSTLSYIFGTGGNLLGGGNHVDEQKNKVSNTVNLIVKGLVCAISILVCIALIYGTIKKNRKMINAWVILKGIECILVLLVIGRLIYAVSVAHRDHRGIVAGLLVGVILEFVLCCYCWLVVYSHYLELGDEENAAANIHSPEGAKLNAVNASSIC